MKKLDKSIPSPSRSNTSLSLDLAALLNPAQAFAHPRDVVADPELTINEKRAMLAAWASNACAVEAAPVLRRPPGADEQVQVDAILEALRALDQAANDTAWARRQTRRVSIENFRRSHPRRGDKPNVSH